MSSPPSLFLCLQAINTVFSIATMDSWTGLMMPLVDYAGPDVDPIRDNNPGVAIYFIVVVVRPRVPCFVVVP